MTFRILVPLDGSAAAEAALTEAGRIAGGDAEVHLLHLVPSLPLTVGPASAGIMDTQDQALSYLANLRGRLPGVRGLDLIRTGTPVDAMLRVALEFKIALIAMSTPARTGPANGFLGSLAEFAVRETELPVLLIRPGLPTHRRTLRRILVPLDGSDESLAILGTVERLAVLTGAEVVLLHVAQRALASVPHRGGRATQGTPEDQEQRLLTIADRLDQSDLVYWQTIAQGNTVDEILHHTDTLDADVIAMSTHVRSRPEQAIFGSVAEAVLGRADRPVLLQRPLLAAIAPESWRYQ